MAINAIADTVSLLKKMSAADMRNRYASSYLGILWVVGKPLLLSCAYILVFGVFMGDGVPGRRYGGASFVPYYMLGFCLWTLFVDVLSRSANLLAENRSLVTKIKFPHYILPLQCCVSALIPFAVIFSIGIASLLYRGGLHWPVQFWYPLLSVICVLLFTIGLSWIVSALGVYTSDLGQFIEVLLMLWFFATPILYPADLISQRSGKARLVLAANPFSSAVDMFRAPFFGIHLTWTLEYTWFCTLSLSLFILGHFIYQKLSVDFADFL